MFEKVTLLTTFQYHTPEQKNTSILLKLRPGPQSEIARDDGVAVASDLAPDR